MRFLPTFALIFCCYLNIWGTQSATIVLKSVEDSYWRDFIGLVPTDAIIGGKDDAGVSTFIGQFSVAAEYGRDRSDFHTVPANIKRGSEIAVAAYNGRSIISNATSNLKVLCGDYASRYKWYSKTSQFPINCRFVVAGYEDKSPMYIGRATHGREVITGKIFADTSNHRPDLIIPYEGKELYPSSYEILTYCF